jgi:hypothetical protein
MAVGNDFPLSKLVNLHFQLSVVALSKATDPRSMIQATNLRPCNHFAYCLLPTAYSSTTPIALNFSMR